MTQISEWELYKCGIDIEKIRERFGSNRTLIIRTTGFPCRNLRLSLCLNMIKVAEKFGSYKDIIIKISNHDEMAKIVIIDQCKPRYEITEADFDKVVGV